MGKLYIRNGGVFIPSGFTMSEIKRMKEQITRMRCCGNCAHKEYADDTGKLHSCNKSCGADYSEWEMRE